MNTRHPKTATRNATRPNTHSLLFFFYFLLFTFSFFRMYPFTAAVRPVLFLPDGHPFLESFDDVATGLKGIGAMRAADGNRHADVADVQPAQAVDQRHVA